MFKQLILIMGLKVAVSATHGVGIIVAEASSPSCGPNNRLLVNLVVLFVIILLVLHVVLEDAQQLVHLQGSKQSAPWLSL